MNSTRSEPLLHGKKVLSLDGGGVKGIHQIVVLEALEKKLGKPLFEYFDMIVGTSAGALVAACIGLLKMRTPEIAALFNKFSDDIFSSKSLFGGGYSEIPLERILKEKLGEEKMLMDFSGGPLVCIVATNNTTKRPRPFLFRNYEPQPSDSKQSMAQEVTEGAPDFLAWKAVRASTAAPTYFPPLIAKIGSSEKTLVDGGILYNNPVEIAFDEASLMFSEVSLIISVGCGACHAEEAKGSFLGILGTIVNTVTDSIEAHHRFQRARRAFKHQGNYVRFNPPSGGEVPLDCQDKGKRKAALDAVHEYVNDGTTQKRMIF